MPKVRYQAIEKAALAVVFSARRLRYYFQSFTVIVMTDLSIRKVLQKPDVAGRMVRWAVELLEFDVQYEPRGPIKGQLYVDFVVELSSAATHQEGADFIWVLSIDGSFNQQGSGAGVILEGPNGLLIEQALRFAFKASNNQAEYETLITGMLLAKEMVQKSTTKETPFCLVYGSDAMIPVEIQENSPRFQNFVAEESNEERKVNLDLLDEVQEEGSIKAEL
ncbi:uncharacterized protein [Phaseolus vulgaris]|uniref:uncharacterized protein n=1 Tax=Phaseolus vulgaris TaxID=3885 RepID=UPI0035C95026